jgi:hypothetical protein
MPTTPVPATGIAILDGNSRFKRALFCLWPGDEDVKSKYIWPGKNKFIAAQCCVPVVEEGSLKWWPSPPDKPSPPAGDKEACRRLALDSGEPSDEAEDCIAGVFDRDPEKNTFVPMTYGQAVSACDAKGLVLCEQSCVNTGCAYNEHPVYSALPCPFRRP